MLCRGVYVVVVCEFAQRKQSVPIMLPFAYEDSNILFEFLVDVFGLTIRLGVVGGGRQNGDSEETIMFAHEFSHELWSAVR